jgi:hypothetical protein
VADYLYVAPKPVVDHEQLAEARQQCQHVLLLDGVVEERYRAQSESEPGRPSKFFNDSVGAYAISREETLTGSLCQELLLLRQNKSERLATYIGREAVYRGTWESIGNTLSISARGYRPGHRPDFVNVSLIGSEGPREIMGGIVHRLTTTERDPVSMMVFATKIENTPPKLLELGDWPDSQILEKIGKIIETKPKGVEKHFNAFKDYFAPSVVDPKKVATLTALKDKELVGKELQDFCRQFGA